MVPAVLFIYGLGAVTGTMVVGGRAADRFPRGVLGLGFSGLKIVCATLALTTQYVGTVVVLVVLLGLVGFVSNLALNSRVAGIAPQSPTLAIAGTTSAFNVGIAIGPWLGGLALSAGHDYPLYCLDCGCSGRACVAPLGLGLLPRIKAALTDSIRTRILRKCETLRSRRTTHRTSSIDTGASIGRLNIVS